MALTTNLEVDHYVDQELRSLPVAAGQHLFKGALLGLTATGYLRGLVAGDAFVGIAYEEVDNTAGDDGDLSARFYTTGDFGYALAGATQADIGRPVFAGDDATLTFDGAQHSHVGFSQDVIATGEIILRIDPHRAPVKTITYPVPDLSAGADLSPVAIHVFDSPAWITAARLLNQGTAASGIDNSNTCQVAVSVNLNAVASATFNASTPFPATNTPHDLGVVINPLAEAGGVLLLGVTNGATANPGPFLVEIDYV